MKSWTAFMKKESLEQIRTGKFLILVIIFCLFGIMNPAIAKLTPWMMELMSESLAETGLVMNQITVNAMTSWVQFYKNLPIALIIFLVMFSNTFTTEIQRGTIILVITKGLNRWKIIAAKTSSMCLIWTIGYLLCYGITYGYNAYFWNNSIAEHLFFSAFCFYLLGLWLITAIPLASSLFTSTSSVLLSVGAEFLAAYLLGLLPKIKQYSPTYLISSSRLLNGMEDITDYLPCIFLAIGLIVIHILVSIAIFNKKNL